MVAVTYLASTLLTGVLLVAVVRWMVDSREWYHYTPTAVPGGGGGGGDAFAAVSRVLRSPITWTLSFLVFAFAAVVGGLSFVGSDIVSLGGPATGLVMGALAVVLLTVYLFVGSYYMARSRGTGEAAATAIGASIVALAVAGAIFLKLLLGV